MCLCAFMHLQMWCAHRVCVTASTCAYVASVGMCACVCTHLNAQRNIQKDVLQANYTFFEKVKIQVFLFLCTGLYFPPWYASSYNQNKNKKANFTMEGRSWAEVFSSGKPLRRKESERSPNLLTSNNC